jgi:glycosyltransferase involved in cell wall biosynthesis
MRILLANYRYFVSSGPERYLFNLTEALEKRSHEVIPFSINYSKNRYSKYSSYFIDPIGTQEQVYFRDHKANPKAMVNTLKRLFFDPEVEKKIIDLIDFSKPDVAYILKYLRKISPAILVGLKKRNIPIVVRLSDFEMACPGLHFLRADKPCEECIDSSIWKSVQYRCVQESYLASFSNLLATEYHRAKKYFSLIDLFIVSNSFMYEKMLKAGIPQNKLQIIPTFGLVPISQKSNMVSSPQFTYIGRLERTKGVHILLEAINILYLRDPVACPSVNIIGEGISTYKDELLSYTKNNNLSSKVNFLGFLDKPGVTQYLSQSWANVIPSIWYENLPNSLIESYMCGVPVLGSNIGSLPEFIRDGETGFLFSPNNPSDLSEKILKAIDPEINRFLRKGVSNYSEHFSEESHLLHLGRVFTSLTNVAF